MNNWTQKGFYYQLPIVQSIDSLMNSLLKVTFSLLVDIESSVPILFLLKK